MFAKFSVPMLSTFIMALVLTPELTTAMSILIAAVCVGLVNLYTARTARLVQLAAIAKAIDPIAAKVEKIAPIVEKIDAHVNSEKTRMEGESAAKTMQINLMRETIDELKKAAALLAQAKSSVDVVNAATRGAGPAPVPVPSSSPVVSSLQKIDENTAKIEQNTSKTEASIADIKEEAAKP